MAAQVTYTPPQADPAVGSALRAFEQTDSMMKRATQMRWMEEDRRKQEAEFIAMQPVLQAKRQADIVTAQATVENAANVQRLRAKFGNESKAAQTEYENAMQLPTYREQSAALSKLQQKYSWFQLIPEGKGFADALANSRVFASQSAIADQELKGRLDIQNAMTDRAREIEEMEQGGMNERANISAGASVERAKIAATARGAAEQMRDPAARIQRYEDLADEFERAGDIEQANHFRSLIQRVTQPLGGGANSNEAFLNSLIAPVPTALGGSIATTPPPLAPAKDPAPTTPGANPPITAPSTKDTLSKVKHW